MSAELRAKLTAAIDAAILESKNDRTGRYVQDFVMAAVERVLDGEEAQAEAEGRDCDALIPYSCMGCGAPAMRPARALLAPFRCDCGGVLVAAPEGQTTERRESVQ